MKEDKFLKVDYHRGVISFNGEKWHVFPWRIVQLLLFFDIILVRLGVSHEMTVKNYFSPSEEKNRFYGDLELSQIISQEMCRNVIAFNEEGKELWRMEDIKIIEDIYRNDIYTNLYVEGENLYCSNELGVDYRVDPKTGEVLEKIYTK